MNIPTIGGTRGIFEIFVPGVFLLLNIGIVTYVFPFLDNRTREVISSITSNSILDLIIAVCFGYLIGILLRLLKTDYVDALSASWLRRYDHNAKRDLTSSDQQKLAELKKQKSRFPWWRWFNKNNRAEAKRIGKQIETLLYKGYATEEFPFIGWVEYVAEYYLPGEAFGFFKKVWKERNRGNKQNKQFFNFCKIVVTANDEKSANEIYAAEALTRYIAGMFYALLAASVLIVITFFMAGLLTSQWSTGLLVVLAAYLLAMHIIVQRFRKMRIREVEVVFATSYKNRQIFESDENETPGK